MSDKLKTIYIMLTKIEEQLERLEERQRAMATALIRMSERVNKLEFQQTKNSGPYVFDVKN